jgi:hypothetical protein
MVVIFIIYLTDCTPLNAIWLQYDPAWAAANQHSCGSQTQEIGVAWASGVLASITDLMAALLSPWLFAQVRLSRRAGIALSVIFTLGLMYVNI